MIGRSFYLWKICKFSFWNLKYWKNHEKRRLNSHRRWVMKSKVWCALANFPRLKSATGGGQFPTTEFFKNKPKMPFFSLFWVRSPFSHASQFASSLGLRLIGGKPSEPDNPVKLACSLPTSGPCKFYYLALHKMINSVYNSSKTSENFAKSDFRNFYVASIGKLEDFKSHIRILTNRIKQHWDFRLKK